MTFTYGGFQSHDGEEGYELPDLHSTRTRMKPVSWLTGAAIS
jgi:hypothetical protein